MKKTYFGNVAFIPTITPAQAAAQDLAKISGKIKEIADKNGLDATAVANEISNLIAQLA